MPCASLAQSTWPTSSSADVEATLATRLLSTVAACLPSCGLSSMKTAMSGEGDAAAPWESRGCGTTVTWTSSACTVIRERCVVGNTCWRQQTSAGSQQRERPGHAERPRNPLSWYAAGKLVRNAWSGRFVYSPSGGGGKRTRAYYRVLNGKMETRLRPVFLYFLSSLPPLCVEETDSASSAGMKICFEMVH